MNLSSWQQIIGEWSIDAFGPGPLVAETLGKLQEETSELAQATPEQMPEEAADVLIVLLSLAHRQEFDLEAALRQKHNINRRRIWLWLNDGISRHAD